MPTTRRRRLPRFAARRRLAPGAAFSVFAACLVPPLFLGFVASDALAAPPGPQRARIGLVSAPAHSASSASRDSVDTTQSNSRRYRHQKSEAIREDQSKIRSLSRPSSYGPDHQPGGYCMYDTQGNVIQRPEGIECEERQGEYLRSTGAAPGPASIAPRRSGCIEGDCKNGDGTYLWSNGAQYSGRFRTGRQHGRGLLLMPDGSSYEGEWRSGQKHGQGTATLADGRVQTGEWRDNQFVDGAGPRRLRIRWPDLSKAPLDEIGGGERDAAVVVGVARYAHVPPVAGATANATDWYSYLVRTRGVPLEQVSLLLDEDATVEEMRFAVTDAARRVKKNGTLWFVFVGHGAPARDGADGLLVGFDAQQRSRSIESRSLRRSELLAALQESEAEQVQVLLDACFSGRTASGAELVAGLQPLVVQPPSQAADPRLTLMTAAGSDEYAGPLPGAERPAFSYLALGGLRGWADDDGDGRITSGELHSYVAQAMQALVRDRKQRPTLVGERDRKLARSGRETGPDIARLVIESASR